MLFSVLLCGHICHTYTISGCLKETSIAVTFFAMKVEYKFIQREIVKHFEPLIENNLILLVSYSEFIVKRQNNKI